VLEYFIQITGSQPPIKLNIGKCGLSTEKIARKISVSQPLILQCIKIFDIKNQPTFSVKYNVSRKVLEDLYINKKSSSKTSAILGIPDRY